MSQELLLERIAELLDREHDAIATIDLDTLAAIQSERSALLAELREADPLRAVGARLARDARGPATSARRRRLSTASAVRSDGSDAAAPPSSDIAPTPAAPCCPGFSTRRSETW